MDSPLSDMSLQKESEWKDEFYRRFQEEYPHLSDEQSEEIKTFVSNILSNREKEIAEEVEKAYKEKSSQLHGGYDDADYLNAYGMAIHDVLQLLKH